MFAPTGGMLVEGACDNGHALVCALHGGRVTGAMVNGSLRGTCPKCGARLHVHHESGVLPVTRLPEQEDAGAESRIVAADAAGKKHSKAG